MPKESLCLKVPKLLGEKTLELANKLGLTDKSVQIQKDKRGFYLFIPISRKPTEIENADIKQHVPESQLDMHVFPDKKQKEKTLAEFLVDQLPSNLITRLPRALDVIGDICIIEIPSELSEYKSVIGEAILNTHRNVRVVLAKAGKVTGTFRLRDLDFIAGEKRTKTLYREYGCSYYVDVAKAYFSPRLSHEHQRVAQLVAETETVVDLFAGVGPFAVPIAKNCSSVKVYAIDINPVAIELLGRNARLNRVESRIHPIVGDARQIFNEKFVGLADRVIMNLPETAHKFIDVACRAIKLSGGVIHFYSFMRIPKNIEDIKQSFSKKVADHSRKVERFTYSKPVRETAPYEYQIVLDAEIR